MTIDLAFKLQSGWEWDVSETHCLRCISSGAPRCCECGRPLVPNPENRSQ
jgi:hypothetical protein